MSRTFKDRPYWVIMNDRSLGTVEHHDHTRRYARGRYKIVSYGERQLVPYGDFKWFLRHTDGVPGMTVEEDKDNRSPYGFRYSDPSLLTRSGALRWYYEQPQRYEYVGREAYWIGPEDVECDLGPFRHGGYRDQPYCTIEPPRENRPYRNYYNRPPAKEDRVLNERRRRSNATQAMHNAVIEYNSHGEVDDFDFAETAPPHGIYGGGWWD